MKDVSELHLAGPEAFRARWEAALAASAPWSERATAEADARKKEAWATCQDLAREPNILQRAAEIIVACGGVGEARTIKLLFLILISRLLPRPASASLKGPSSGGKSFLLDQVLRLFPERCAYILSAMSERALAYSDESLVHRFLIIYEAVGLAGDFASYLVRSLLSEGRIRYQTVEKTKEGMKPRLIERAGPTGLLVTTTAVHLHPENETRMLSIPVTDTPEQTRRILAALAAESVTAPDVSTWHALQEWLESAEHRVVIPYAQTLADLVPPVAVRLRRDFGLVLTLIRAHAILHQASRGRDHDGRIIAELQDYGAVRELVADLVADAVEATVPLTVRETVEAVQRLIEAKPRGGTLTGLVRDTTEVTLSVSEIAKELKIDKSAASRRIGVARERGYLKNLETKRGQPAKIALGEPLPEDMMVLPDVDVLRDRCSVDRATAGVSDPPPPSHANGHSLFPGVGSNGHNPDAFSTCCMCREPLSPGRKYQCQKCEELIDARVNFPHDE